MHDLDRTQLEFEEPEFEDEHRRRPCGCRHGQHVFNESEEMELASELLEVTDEAEMDQFLGKLIKGAVKKVGRFLKSPVGHALFGVLKGAVKQVFPVAGPVLDVVGKAISPGKTNGQSNGGSAPAAPAEPAPEAGELFGMELEGLSAEDQQFEIARRFVRLGADAANEAASAPDNVPPPAAARIGFARAAARHAPGFANGRSSSSPAHHGQRTGRWVRRGGKIILFGV